MVLALIGGLVALAAGGELLIRSSSRLATDLRVAALHRTHGGRLWHQRAKSAMCRIDELLVAPAAMEATQSWLRFQQLSSHAYRNNEVTLHRAQWHRRVV